LRDYFTQMEELRDLMIGASLAGDLVFFLIVAALMEESYAVYTLILHLLSKMRGLFPAFFCGNFTCNIPPAPFFNRNSPVPAGNIWSDRKSLEDTGLTPILFPSGGDVSRGLPFPACSIPADLGLNRRQPSPPSAGAKYLHRLFCKGIDVSKLSIFGVYASLLSTMQATSPDNSDTE